MNELINPIENNDEVTPQNHIENNDEVTPQNHVSQTKSSRVQLWRSLNANDRKHANLLVNQLRNGKIEKKYLDISTQRDIIEFEDGTKLVSFNLKNYVDWIITKINQNTDNEGSLDVLWTDSHFGNPFLDKKYGQDLLALEYASMEDGQPTNHVNRGIKFIDGEELDFSIDPVLITGLQENSWEEALMYMKKKGGDGGVIVEGSFHRRKRFQLISEENVPVKDFLIRDN